MLCDTEDAFHVAVKQVLDMFPSPMLLANSIDVHGQRVLPLATPTCKQHLLDHTYFMGRYQFMRVKPEVVTKAVIVRVCQHYDCQGNVDSETPMVLLVFYRSKAMYRDNATLPACVERKYNTCISINRDACALLLLHSYDSEADAVFLNNVMEKGVEHYMYCNVYCYKPIQVQVIEVSAVVGIDDSTCNGVYKDKHFLPPINKLPPVTAPKPPPVTASKPPPVTAPSPSKWKKRDTKKLLCINRIKQHMSEENSHHINELKGRLVQHLTRSSNNYINSSDNGTDTDHHYNPW